MKDDFRLLWKQQWTVLLLLMPKALLLVLIKW